MKKSGLFFLSSKQEADLNGGKMQPLQQLQQLWTSLMLIPASPEAAASLLDITRCSRAC